MNLALVTSRVVFSLVLIIGLIYFVMYLLRRASSNGKKSFIDKNMFSILGQLHLAPKKSIYLVRAGEKVLVLGVGNEIHLLLVIENEEIIKSLEGEPKNSLRIKGFSEYLKKAFSLKPKGVQGIIHKNG